MFEVAITAPSPARQRPLLLLIEDNRDSLVAGSHLLTAAGFEVEIARGGDDGLAKAARMQPNVIVTDLMMLPTGGLEVCERLHGNAVTRNIPVIVYTGVTDPTILGLLRKFGVRVFAIKPCVPTAIGKEAHALLVGRPGSQGVRIVSGYGERLGEFERDIEAVFQHDSPNPRKNQ